MFKEESRYNVYSETENLVAFNVSFNEALTWLAKGITSDFHLTYLVKEVKN